MCQWRQLMPKQDVLTASSNPFPTESHTQPIKIAMRDTVTSWPPYLICHTNGAQACWRYTKHQACQTIWHWYSSFLGTNNCCKLATFERCPTNKLWVIETIECSICSPITSHQVQDANQWHVYSESKSSTKACLQVLAHCKLQLGVATCNCCPLALDQPQ